MNVLNAFAPLCSTDGLSCGRSEAAAKAFTRNWLEFADTQQALAQTARAAFLDRYEWPSLWETREVVEALHQTWLDSCTDADEQTQAPLDPVHCPDRSKPRATVAEYVALIGEDVAWNLEGIARARLEKRPRQYQSDAAVHQTFMKATTGGGELPGGEDAVEGEAGVEAPKAVQAFFEPIPWDVSSDRDMRAVLDFQHRVRLTPFAKDFLALPCMATGSLDSADADPTCH